ncbi:hypothetical protein CEXT_23441 [Caerostris extrusa]|uniref:Uncharacterized protein n=1 Tax=Caerostris extrusa TaxID=172846 RepID=A0AAV4P6I2_CAEEX|nr:hypothetical protein CEXT_23441 [Caerostris extrusa]
MGTPRLNQASCARPLPAFHEVFQQARRIRVSDRKKLLSWAFSAKQIWEAVVFPPARTKKSIHFHEERTDTENEKERSKELGRSVRRWKKKKKSAKSDKCPFGQLRNIYSKEKSDIQGRKTKIQKTPSIFHSVCYFPGPPSLGEILHHAEEGVLHIGMKGIGGDGIDQFGEFYSIDLFWIFENEVFRSGFSMIYSFYGVLDIGCDTSLTMVVDSTSSFRCG